MRNWIIPVAMVMLLTLPAVSAGASQPDEPEEPEQSDQIDTADSERERSEKKLESRSGLAHDGEQLLRGSDFYHAVG